ncbi:ComEC/Rec2 family competence protein [Kitasatospora cineracea]
MSDNLPEVGFHAVGTGADSLGVTILDVGHGNSAVVHDGSLCAVIDAGRSSTVPQAELERRKVSRMVHLVLSHGDEDHIGGSPALLLDDAFTIGTVWFNPDWRKDTAVWNRLLMAVKMRKRRGGLGGHQMITTETGQLLRCGRARLEVLHPDSTMVLGGDASQPSQHGPLTSNSTSVVIRVHLDEQPVALLAADVDTVGLAHIVDSQQELTAPVLVFPHHGGLPGTNRMPRKFARKLTELVSPDLVIFSIGGGLRPRNPHQEIVAGVREAAPEAHIACTQLSAHCHNKDQKVTDDHLAQRPAAGRVGGRCCAGTISVTADAGELFYDPPLEKHRDFVTVSVESAQCRVLLPLPRQRAVAGAVTQPTPSTAPKA